MASISTDSKDRRQVFFYAPDGRRRSFRIGVCSQENADKVKMHADELEAAGRTNTRPAKATEIWLAGVSDELHERMARVGLVKGRAKAPLKSTLDAMVDGRADIKPASKTAYKQVIRDLVDFYGADRDISSINPVEAESFKTRMLTRHQLGTEAGKLAGYTVHKRIKAARYMFADLLRRGIIDVNPFANVKHNAAGIKDRQRFISLADAAKLIEAAPNTDWKAIIALSRFGGLRCPSETLSLKWVDIDWEKGRVCVPCIKTEGIGKAYRVMPLFPELHKVLLDALHQAPVGAEYVIGNPVYRAAAMGADGWKNANLRTTFRKIVKRAGLEPWPRLFHNLRASRETELAERYPIQNVTSWLGNTPAVALKHYIQARDTYLDQAANEETPADRVMQKAQQQDRKTSRMIGNDGIDEIGNTPCLPMIPDDARSSKNLKMEPSGLEPPTPALQRQCSPN